MRSWILQNLKLEVSKSITHLPNRRIGELGGFCCQTRTHIGQDTVGFDEAENWTRVRILHTLTHSMFFVPKF